MKGYTAAYGHIYDGDELIDSGVLLVYIAPHSYTGENVAEISCHGGLYVTKEFLELYSMLVQVWQKRENLLKEPFLTGKLA